MTRICTAQATQSAIISSHSPDQLQPPRHRFGAPQQAPGSQTLNVHTPDGAPATPALVIALLEDAGTALLALPQSGPSTRLRQSGLEWVRDVTASTDRTRLRPAPPSAAAIDRMDRVLAWIPRIPADKFVLRRIVGARCLVNPLTGRYLYAWRRIATAIGADHKAVQRWHAQGIDLIVKSLNQPTPLPRAGEWFKPGSRPGPVK